jgi:uncharacterized protein (TIGR03083 family)
MADRKEKVLEKLAKIRQELLDLVAEVDEAGWERKVWSESEEWRVSDLFRHIVGAEPSMAKLIENIRDGGKGASPEFDLARWNASRVKKTQNKSIDDLTADLAQNRVHLLSVVETLEEDDWDKKGLHGSMQVMTIEEILHRIADHEAHHMEDIRRATG